MRLGAEWRIVPTLTLRNELYFLKTDRHWLDVENYAFVPEMAQVDRTSYIEIFHDEHQIGNRLDVRLDVLHWHHVLGLVAAVPLCTWIVSGWMSLEPGQWISDRAIDRVMSERYTGLDRLLASFTIPPATTWQAASMVPVAKEVRLQFWEGKPLYVFASSSDHRKLISGDDRPIPVVIGSPEVVARTAQRLLPDVRVAQVIVLHAYDFYWYAHHTPRPLPVLRLRFDDPYATWLHIDPTTGDVLELLDTSRRWYRILFNALHSLDFPLLLAYRPAWDLVVLTLCGLGLTLSVTAVVIAWRRLETVWRS